MPKLLVFGRYIVFFWVGDDGEPIHVHIAIKRPQPHATKVWLTADGGCYVSNNDGSIPQKDLNRLLKLISANHGYICDRWKLHFNSDPRFIA